MMILQPNLVPSSPLIYFIWEFFICPLLEVGPWLLCITRAARNASCGQDLIVSKSIVERNTFTKNVLANVMCVTRNQMP